MSARKVKKELIDRFYIGTVEDNIDPKRKGRIKVRVDRLHGKIDSNKFIPTEDLPWAIPALTLGGGSFGVPSMNKIVYLSHIEGDFYSPEYFKSEHYNFNLQEKLESFDDDGYQNFYAMTYDDSHQYYHEKGKGVVFDFVKSNMNLKENGDIQMNLRDNQSKLFLGTEDASQQAVLGNHFFNWMDEFVQNLIGAKGGPYLGNLTAPIIPNPGMIEVLNKYLSLRETFLSDHVFIVDDNRVKQQDRKFDLDQHDDNWNTELLETKETTPASGYQSEERRQGADGPCIDDIPPNLYSDNLSSSKMPPNPTENETKRTLKPFSNPNYGNGTIPIEQMTINKYLLSTFPSDTDERKFLLDEPAKTLDRMLNYYHEIKDSDMPKITVVKGYQNLDRQNTIREQYPQISPLPGKDPFGFGNQVELWFSVKKSNTELVNNIKKIIKTGLLREDAEPQEKTMKWLIDNSKLYKWTLVGRTSTGDLQWWHWLYDPTIDSGKEIIFKEPNPNVDNISQKSLDSSMSPDAIAKGKKEIQLKETKDDKKVFNMKFLASKIEDGLSKKFKIEGKTTTLMNYIIDYFVSNNIPHGISKDNDKTKIIITSVTEIGKFTEEKIIDDINTRFKKIHILYRKIKVKKKNFTYTLFE